MKPDITYGYNNNTFAASSITYPFSSIIIGSLLRPMTCLVTFFPWQLYYLWVFVTVGLNSDQKVICNSIDIHAAIELLGMSFQASY